MLVDTHCHLDGRYCPDPDAMLARAAAVGVSACVSIGVGGAEAARQAVALAERRPDVVATVGVHPHDAAELDAPLEAELLELLGRPRVVAFGEVGLDHHYDHSPRARQAEVFRWAVQVARRARKPLVIHTREAPAETLDILRSEGAREVGGIIHCFSEDRAFAEAALELDFDLSFSGIVTFKSARSVHEVAAWAPADRILVETDAPYLAPVPHRGKPCEPAHVALTARRVAELRGVTFEALARQTTANAVRRLGPALAAAVAGGRDAAHG